MPFSHGWERRVRAATYAGEQRARARHGDATDQPYVAVAVARPSTAVPTEPLSEVGGRARKNRDVRRALLRTREEYRPAGGVGVGVGGQG
jgi:hypothetical protein